MDAPLMGAAALGVCLTGTVPEAQISAVAKAMAGGWLTARKLVPRTDWSQQQRQVCVRDKWWARVIRGWLLPGVLLSPHALVNVCASMLRHRPQALTLRLASVKLDMAQWWPREELPPLPAAAAGSS